MLRPVKHELAALRTGTTTFDEADGHKLGEARRSHRLPNEHSATITVEKGAHDLPPNAGRYVEHRRVQGGTFTNRAAEVVARRILVPSCVQA
jgi:hypothetical protein